MEQALIMAPVAAPLVIGLSAFTTKSGDHLAGINLVSPRRASPPALA